MSYQDDEFIRRLNRSFYLSVRQKVEMMVRRVIEKELRRHHLKTSSNPRELPNKRRNVYDVETGRKVGSFNVEMIARRVVSQIMVKFKGIVARRKVDSLDYSKINKEIQGVLRRFFEGR